MLARAIRSPRTVTQQCSTRRVQRNVRTLNWRPVRHYAAGRQWVPPSPVKELEQSSKDARMGRVRKDGTSPRFFKDVYVVKTPKGYEVELDNRYAVASQKTDTRITLPTEELAVCLASDFEYHHNKLDLNRMPMYSLISSVFDAPDELIQKYRAAIVGIFETDATCLREEHNPDVISAQKAYHTPIVNWFQRELDIKLSVANIYKMEQPEESVEIVRKYVDDLDRWMVVGVHGLVDSVSSFVTAMALWHDKISVQDALVAGRLEQYLQESKGDGVRGAFRIKHEEQKIEISTALLYLKALNAKPLDRETVAQIKSRLGSFSKV